MTDEEIVFELKKGNTTVLKHCYKKALGQVEGMMIKNGGSKEDAKDLFHDALIVLNSNCRNTDFQLTSSLSTYLFSICRYSWLNQVNKKKKGEEMIRIVYEETWQLAYKSTNELVDSIMEAMDRLGNKCKEILLDYYYGKYSYKEIAENLSYASAQVVRQQKYRCIQKLKETTDYVVNE